VRDEKEYFPDIEDVDTPKDMIDLAGHILRGKAGHFEPKKFVDHYETALRELLRQKESGRPIEAKKRREPARVINLMEALRRSAETSGSAARARPRSAAKRTVRSRRAS
jgi:DNA end-binding protein Ku